MFPGTEPTEPAAAIMDAELMLLMGPGEDEKPSGGCVETTEDRCGLTEPFMFIFMFRPQGNVLDPRGEGTLEAQF